MPDKNAVGKRLILADNGRKVEETEDADRIAIALVPAQPSMAVTNRRT
jgi:hypothetical protein